LVDYLLGTKYVVMLDCKIYLICLACALGTLLRNVLMG
jgi:hypothetical protein